MRCFPLRVDRLLLVSTFERPVFRHKFVSGSSEVRVVGAKTRTRLCFSLVPGYARMYSLQLRVLWCTLREEVPEEDGLSARDERALVRGEEEPRDRGRVSDKHLQTHVDWIISCTQTCESLLFIDRWFNCHQPGRNESAWSQPTPQSNFQSNLFNSGAIFLSRRN